MLVFIFFILADKMELRKFSNQNIPILLLQITFNVLFFTDRNTRNCLFKKIKIKLLFFHCFNIFHILFFLGFNHIYYIIRRHFALPCQKTYVHVLFSRIFTLKSNNWHDCFWWKKISAILFTENTRFLGNKLKLFDKLKFNQVL